MISAKPLLGIQVGAFDDDKGTLIKPKTYRSLSNNRTLVSLLVRLKYALSLRRPEYVEQKSVI